jgi:ABC-type multidrug transport system fused ATPase/permease subunit
MPYKRDSLVAMRQKQHEKFEKKLNQRHSMFSTMKKVFFYAKEYKKYLYWTFFFDLINSIFELLIPIYLGKCINCIAGVKNVDFSNLTINVLLMILFVIIAQVSNLLGSITINNYNYKATYKITSYFLHRHIFAWRFA